MLKGKWLMATFGGKNLIPTEGNQYEQVEEMNGKTG